jgi:hypothetical protein
VRSLDPQVPPEYRKDYLEAAAILDISPRMSAVMSRRVLAELLKKYAGLKQRGLEAQVDAFIADISIRSMSARTSITSARRELRRAHAKG